MGVVFNLSLIKVFSNKLLLHILFSVFSDSSRIAMRHAHSALGHLISGNQNKKKENEKCLLKGAHVICLAELL